MQKDRSAIRYEQFARPRSNNRKWAGMGAAFSFLALAGAGAYFLLGEESAAHGPPPALSSAGGPIANEAYQWKAVAIGAGGFITGLSQDPSGQTMVVRTDVYGAYIWDAKGDRWQQLLTAPAMPQIDRVQDGIAQGVYEIAVAPSKPDRIYMAIKGRVYRTDDGGRNWTLPSMPEPLGWDANSAYRTQGPYLAVDPVNPDLVFLGSPFDGLWRSADGGAHWARVSSIPVGVDRSDAPGLQMPGTMIWFEQALGGKASGRIFSQVSGRGVYVSSDKGLSFTPLSSGTAHPVTIRRAVFDRKGIFFCVDEKSQAIWAYEKGSWRNVSEQAGLPPMGFVAIAANPSADQLVVFDGSGAGYQSSDGGRTWGSLSHTARAGEKDPPWLRIADQSFFATADIHFDAKVPNRLWVAAGMGVFHADLPPGSVVAQWESQSRGIEELVANDVVQAPGQSPAFAAWDFGIHVKDDLNAYSTGYGPRERVLIAAQQLDWSPADPRFMVTNASDTRLSCCWQDGNAVLAGTSKDGGRSWRKFASLPVPPGTKEDDAWRMSFGTIAVSASDPKNIVWAPAFNRQPFVTGDQGASWRPVNLPGAVGDTPGSFKEFYYQRKTLAADKVKGGTFYLYHSGEAPNVLLAGLWRSRDAGESWQKVFGGEISPQSNYAAKLRAVPGKEGHLFFTSGHSTAADTRLRRSLDGGAHWSILETVDRVDDVAFGKAAPGAAYPTIFLSGRVGGIYGIWRSVDDTTSWQRLVDFPAGTLDQVTVMAGDPDIFGRVYLGYKGSGWIWGEPAPCKPAPLASLEPRQCSKVGG